MEDLLQFVPEDKREQFSEAAKSYIKADDDVLLDFVGKNDSLVDRLSKSRIETRERNMREKEFPKLIEEERKRLMAEINPEETPEQKRLRELEQKLADKERKEQEFERRSALREKYKDVAPSVAEILAPLSDDAVEKTVNYVAELNKKIDELEKQIKYAGKPPVGGGGSGPVMSYKDFSALPAKEQAAFVEKGGTIGE